VTARPRPFRVVLVGVGGVSRFWLPVLAVRPDVEVVAVVEPAATRAATALAGHGLAAPTFATITAAAAATDADLAINLTPPHLHRASVEEALAAGLDVLTEKPLADTLADAVALEAIAREAGRTLAVMQNRRHHPALAGMRAALVAGRIGRTGLVGADMFMAPRFVPDHFVRAMRHPLILDVAIHTFDQARFLTGLDAVAVTCLEREPPGSGYAGAAIAVCTFELEDDVPFSYRGSYATPGFPTSWDAAWRVAGDRGTLTWDSVGDAACESLSGAAASDLFEPVVRTTIPGSRPGDTTGHAGAINALLDDLGAGRTPPTIAADNLQSMAMVFGALASAARGGERITIAETLAAAGG
jgi:predicted dehydrogenase